MRAFLASSLLAVLSASPGPKGSPSLVRVRVLHGGAPPTEQVELRLYEANSPLCGTSQRLGAPVARPDSAGWAEFPGVAPGEYSVEAESDVLGHARAGVVVPAKEPVVLDWPMGLDVSALVLDESGKPAPATRVWLVPEEPSKGSCIILNGNDGKNRCAVRTGDAGPDGRVRFRGLRSGKYAVVPQTEDWGYGQGVAARAGGDAVTVRLPRLKHVRGAVVDWQGAALPGTARVVADAWPNVERTVGLDGDFDGLLDAVPERPRQSRGRGVDSEAGGRFDVPLAFGGQVELYALAGCSKTEPVRAKVGDENVTLKLPRPAPVTGRLVAPGGRRLPRTVSFEAYCGYQTICRLEPQPLSGDRFTIPDVLPGCEWVSIDVPGYLPTSFTPNPARGSLNDVGEVKLQRGVHLSGWVKDSAGRPVTGVTVVLRKEGEEPSKYGAQFARVDSSGRWSLGMVRPEAVYLRVIEGESRRTESELLTLVDGEERSVVITIP